MPAHGKDQLLTLDIAATAAGSLTSVTANLVGSAVDFGRDIESLVVTAAGDSSNVYILGLRNATFSIEFDMNTTMLGYIEDIYAEKVARQFDYRPMGGSASPYKKYTGSAFLINPNISSPIGLISLTTEWQVSGDVTPATAD